MGTLLRSCVKVREAIKLPFGVVSGVDCRVRIRWGLHMAKGGGHFFLGGGWPTVLSIAPLAHCVVCLSVVCPSSSSVVSLVCDVL